MAGISVTIEGLDKVLDKLDKKLYAGPLKKFLTRAAIVVQGRAREKAPVKTTRLRTSILYEVDPSTPPMYAKVGSDVEYAPYQEFGTSRGLTGRHYLQGGFEESQGDIAACVDALSSEIASAWGG